MLYTIARESVKSVMNVIFIASTAGRDSLKETYGDIIRSIKKTGNNVDDKYLSLGGTSDNGAKSDDEMLHELLSDLKKADALFVDVTLPSFTMGYFTSVAVQLGKAVVILTSSPNFPVIFKFLEKISDKVQIVKYTSANDIERGITSIFDFINDSQDTRFNFFISPSLSNYLDWVSKTKKIPRSVYLRNLLETDMDKFKSEL